MLAVISPAKTLDFSTPVRLRRASVPEFALAAAELARTMQKKKPAQLRALMSLSDDLATLNYTRFQRWSPTPAPTATRQALFAFMGDVYVGLDARSLNTSDLDFAQKHLRILSGLYGVLRPFDLIQPYRLEMGTALVHGRARSLYAFWGAQPAAALKAQADVLGTRTLVNLASQEYFKAVDLRHLGLEVITPVFKDLARGQYRVLSFFAKRARGLLARFMIEQRCRKAADLRAFDDAGYAYNAALSTPSTLVFTRESPPNL